MSDKKAMAAEIMQEMQAQNEKSAFPIMTIIFCENQVLYSWTKIGHGQVIDGITNIRNQLIQKISEEKK